MRQRGKSFSFTLRAIALFTVFTFTVTNAAVAFPGKTGSLPVTPEVTLPSLAARMEIPENFGRIIDRSSFPSAATVIHIQDAHASNQAQESIRNILRYLRKTYGIRQVFLEGGVDEIRPELLLYFKEKEQNEKLADIFAQESLIGGAEKFALEQYYAGQPFSVHGIENTALYEKNLTQYREILSVKEQTGKFADRLKSEILSQSSRAFNKALAEFFREWVFYQDIPAEALQHIAVLEKQAKDSLELDFRDPQTQIEWPQLARFARLKDLETKIDLKKAEEEKKQLQSWMAGKGLHDEAFEKMLESPDNPSAFENARVITEKFHHAASAKGFRFESYPALSFLIGRAILHGEIEASAFFEEMQKLTERLLSRLARTEREKELIQIYEDYLLLRKLFTLELMRPQYELLENKGEAVSPSGISRRLGKKPAPELDKVYRNALDFYDVAVRREQSMLERVREKMAASGKETSVLITGGFHSEGLKEDLKSRRISYVEIQPHMSDLDDTNHYSKVMMLPAASSVNHASLPDSGLEQLKIASRYRQTAFSRAAEFGRFFGIRPAAPAPKSEMRNLPEMPMTFQAAPSREILLRDHPQLTEAFQNELSFMETLARILAARSGNNFQDFRLGVKGFINSTTGPSRFPQRLKLEWLIDAHRDNLSEEKRRLIHLYAKPDEASPLILVAIGKDLPDTFSFPDRPFGIFDARIIDFSPDKTIRYVKRFNRTLRIGVEGVTGDQYRNAFQNFLEKYFVVGDQVIAGNLSGFGFEAYAEEQYSVPLWNFETQFIPGRGPVFKVFQGSREFDTVAAGIFRSEVRNEDGKNYHFGDANEKSPLSLLAPSQKEFIHRVPKTESLDLKTLKPGTVVLVTTKADWSYAIEITDEHDLKLWELPKDRGYLVMPISEIKTFAIGENGETDGVIKTGGILNLPSFSRNGNGELVSGDGDELDWLSTITGIYVQPSYVRPEDRANSASFHELMKALGFELYDQTGKIKYSRGYKVPALKFNLAIIPHGETDANSRGLMHGSDVDGLPINLLNEKGKQQALEGGPVLLKLIQDLKLTMRDLVFLRTPMKRTQETADLSLKAIEGLNGGKKIVHLHIEDLAREIFFGSWHAKTYDTLTGAEHYWGEQYRNHSAFARAPNGENFLLFLNRVNQLIRKLNREYAGKTVVLYGHGTFAAALKVLFQSPDVMGKDHIEWRHAIPPRGEPYFIPANIRSEVRTQTAEDLAGQLQLAGQLKTILLVEDDDAVRDSLEAVLERVLSRFGIQLRTAADGVPGLALAKQEMPDLIISDGKMPRMYGPEMIQEIRGHAGRPVPVIFIGSNPAAGIENLINVNKPISVEMVRKVIETLAVRSEARVIEERNLKLDLGSVVPLQVVLNQASDMFVVATQLVEIKNQRGLRLQFTLPSGYYILTREEYENTGGQIALLDDDARKHIDSKRFDTLPNKFVIFNPKKIYETPLEFELTVAGLRQSLGAVRPYKRSEVRLPSAPLTRPRVVLFDVDGVLFPAPERTELWNKVALDLRREAAMRGRNIPLPDGSRLRKEVFYLAHPGEKDRGSRYLDLLKGNISPDAYMAEVNLRLRQQLGVDFNFTLNRWMTMVFETRETKSDRNTETIQKVLANLSLKYGFTETGILSDRQVGDDVFFKPLIEKTYPDVFKPGLIFTSPRLRAAKIDGSVFPVVFEQLRKMLGFEGLQPKDILFLDDRNENLEFARRLGFQTRSYVYGQAESLDSVLRPFFEITSRYIANHYNKERISLAINFLQHKQDEFGAGEKLLEDLKIPWDQDTRSRLEVLQEALSLAQNPNRRSEMRSQEPNIQALQEEASLIRLRRFRQIMDMPTTAALMAGKLQPSQMRGLSAYIVESLGPLADQKTFDLYMAGLPDEVKKTLEQKPFISEVLDEVRKQLPNFSAYAAQSATVQTTSRGMHQRPFAAFREFTEVIKDEAFVVVTTLDGITMMNQLGGYLLFPMRNGKQVVIYLESLRADVTREQLARAADVIRDYLQDGVLAEQIEASIPDTEDEVQGGFTYEAYKRRLAEIFRSEVRQNFVPEQFKEKIKAAQDASSLVKIFRQIADFSTHLQAAPLLFDPVTIKAVDRFIDDKDSNGVMKAYQAAVDRHYTNRLREIAQGREPSRGEIQMLTAVFELDPVQRDFTPPTRTKKAEAIVRERIQAMQKAWPEFSKWWLGYVKGSKIKTIPVDTLWRVYLPYSQWIVEQKRAKRPDSLYMVGFYGSQGRGKTVTSRALVPVLNALLDPVTEGQAVARAVDDYYKSKADREAMRPLGYDAGPGVSNRGPAGTHYTDWILRNMREFETSTPDSRIEAGEFDKSIDDLAPAPFVITGKVGVFLFDGWFTGAETDFDLNDVPPGTFQYTVAKELKGDYKKIFDRMDALWAFDTPSVETIRANRKQQEALMFQQTGRRGMSDEQIDAFIDYFTKHSWQPGVTSFIPPMKNVTHFVTIRPNRRIASVQRGGRRSEVRMVKPSREGLINLLKEQFPRIEDGEKVFYIRETSRLRGVMRSGHVEEKIQPELSAEKLLHKDVQEAAETLKRFFPDSKIKFLLLPLQKPGEERLGHDSYRQATYFKSQLILEESIFPKLADLILISWPKIASKDIFAIKENEPFFIRFAELMEFLRESAPEPEEITKDMAKERLEEASRGTYYAWLDDIDGNIADENAQVPEDIIKEYQDGVNSGKIRALVSGRAEGIDYMTKRHGIHDIGEVSYPMRQGMRREFLPNFLIFPENGTYAAWWEWNEREGQVIKKEVDLVRHYGIVPDDFQMDKTFRDEFSQKLSAYLESRGFSAVFELIEPKRYGFAGIINKTNHPNPSKTADELVEPIRAFLAAHPEYSLFEVAATSISVDVQVKGLNKMLAVRYMSERFGIAPETIVTSDDKSSAIGNGHAFTNRLGGFSTKEYDPLSPEQIPLVLALDGKQNLDARRELGKLIKLSAFPRSEMRETEKAFAGNATALLSSATEQIYHYNHDKGIYRRSTNTWARTEKILKASRERNIPEAKAESFSKLIERGEEGSRGEYSSDIREIRLTLLGAKETFIAVKYRRYYWSNYTGSKDLKNYVILYHWDAKKQEFEKISLQEKVLNLGESPTVGGWFGFVPSPEDSGKVLFLAINEFGVFNLFDPLKGQRLTAQDKRFQRIMTSILGPLTLAESQYVRKSSARLLAEAQALIRFISAHPELNPQQFTAIEFGKFGFDRLAVTNLLERTAVKNGYAERSGTRTFGKGSGIKGRHNTFKLTTQAETYLRSNAADTVSEQELIDVLKEKTLRSETRNIINAREQLAAGSQDYLEFMAALPIEGEAEPVHPADAGKFNFLMLALGTPSPQTFVNTAKEIAKWRTWNLGDGEIKIVASTGAGRGLKRLADNTQTYYAKQSAAAGEAFRKFREQTGAELTEAKVIRYILQYEGVTEPIFLEQISTNTIGNILQSKEVIKKQVLPTYKNQRLPLKIQISTDGFHRPRSLMFALHQYRDEPWKIASKALYVPRLENLPERAFIEYLEFLWGYPQEFNEPGRFTGGEGENIYNHGYLREKQGLEPNLKPFDFSKTPWPNIRLYAFKNLFYEYLSGKLRSEVREEPYPRYRRENLIKKLEKINGEKSGKFSAKIKHLKKALKGNNLTEIETAVKALKAAAQEDAEMYDAAQHILERERAKAPLAHAAEQLKGAGYEDIAGALKNLYPIVETYLDRGRHGNSVNHSPQVVDFAAEILLGEKASKVEVKRGVIAALMHDAGFAFSHEKKIRKRDIDAAKNDAEKEALRQELIFSRQSHMKAGAKLAGEVLEDYNRRFGPFFSASDIREIQRIILHHDDPSIQEQDDGNWLFDAQDRGLMFQREADRVTMLTAEDVEQNLERDRKRGLEIDPVLTVTGVIERQSDEYRLYAKAFGEGVSVYDFKGETLYRTNTGYKIFNRLVQGLYERFNVPADRRRSEIRSWQEDQVWGLQSFLDSSFNGAVVIGGSGFVGSHLAEALAKNEEVAIPFRSRQAASFQNIAAAGNNIEAEQAANRFYAVETQNFFDPAQWGAAPPSPEQLKQFISKAAVIYHLAAQPNPNPSPGQSVEDYIVNTLVTNVFLTKLLARFARETGKPMVYGSSGHIFAMNPLFEKPIEGVVTEETQIPFYPETVKFMEQVNSGFNQYIDDYMAGKTVVPPSEYAKQLLRTALVDSRVPDLPSITIFQLFEKLQQLNHLKKNEKEKAPAYLEELRAQYPPDLTFGLYAVSKILPEQDVMSLPAGKGAVLRFANIYGPRMRMDSPRLFVTRLLNGQPVGYSPHSRDYVSYKDAIPIIENIGRAVETGQWKQNELIHLYSGKGPYTIQKLLEAAQEAVGTNVPANQMSDIPDLLLPRMSNEKMIRLSGITPQVSLAEGLFLIADDLTRSEVRSGGVAFEQAAPARLRALRSLYRMSYKKFGAAMRPDKPVNRTLIYLMERGKRPISPEELKGAEIAMQKRTSQAVRALRDFYGMSAAEFGEFINPENPLPEKKMAITKGMVADFTFEEMAAIAKFSRSGRHREQMILLRKFLDLGQEEFGKVLNPGKPFLEAAVSQWETKKSPIPFSAYEMAARVGLSRGAVMVKTVRAFYGKSKVDFGALLRPDNPFSAEEITLWEEQKKMVPADAMKKVNELLVEPGDRLREIRGKENQVDFGATIMPGRKYSGPAVSAWEKNRNRIPIEVMKAAAARSEIRSGRTFEMKIAMGHLSAVPGTDVAIRYNKMLSPLSTNGDFGDHAQFYISSPGRYILPEDYFDYFAEKKLPLPLTFFSSEDQFGVHLRGRVIIGNDAVKDKNIIFKVKEITYKNVTLEVSVPPYAENPQVYKGEMALEYLKVVPPVLPERSFAKMQEVRKLIAAAQQKLQEGDLTHSESAYDGAVQALDELVAVMNKDFEVNSRKRRPSNLQFIYNAVERARFSLAVLRPRDLTPAQKLAENLGRFIAGNFTLREGLLSVSRALWSNDFTTAKTEARYLLRNASVPLAGLLEEIVALRSEIRMNKERRETAARSEVRVHPLLGTVVDGNVLVADNDFFKLQRLIALLMRAVPDQLHAIRVQGTGANVFEHNVDLMRARWRSVETAGGYNGLSLEGLSQPALDFIAEQDSLQALAMTALFPFLLTRDIVPAEGVIAFRDKFQQWVSQDLAALVKQFNRFKGYWVPSFMLDQPEDLKFLFLHETLHRTIEKLPPAEKKVLIQAYLTFLTAPNTQQKLFGFFQNTEYMFEIERDLKRIAADRGILTNPDKWFVQGHSAFLFMDEFWVQIFYPGHRKEPGYAGFAEALRKVRNQPVYSAAARILNRVKTQSDAEALRKFEAVMAFRAVAPQPAPASDILPASVPPAPASAQAVSVPELIAKLNSMQLGMLAIYGPGKMGLDGGLLDRILNMNPATSGFTENERTAVQNHYNAARSEVRVDVEKISGYLRTAQEKLALARESVSVQEWNPFEAVRSVGEAANLLGRHADNDARLAQVMLDRLVTTASGAKRYERDFTESAYRKEIEGALAAIEETAKLLETYPGVKRKRSEVRFEANSVKDYLDAHGIAIGDLEQVYEVAQKTLPVVLNKTSAAEVLNAIAKANKAVKDQSSARLDKMRAAFTASLRQSGYGWLADDIEKQEKPIYLVLPVEAGFDMESLGLLSLISRTSTLDVIVTGKSDKDEAFYNQKLAQILAAWNVNPKVLNTVRFHLAGDLKEAGSLSQRLLSANKIQSRGIASDREDVLKPLLAMPVSRMHSEKLKKQYHLIALIAAAYLRDQAEAQALGQILQLDSWLEQRHLNAGQLAGAVLQAMQALQRAA